MANRITKRQSEFDHSASVHTGQDYVSEYRFRKCLFDAVKKVTHNCSTSTPPEEIKSKAEVVDSWFDYKPFPLQSKTID